MQNEKESCLYTLLLHSSGQWIQSKMSMNVKSDGRTNELQVMGSIISYLRRYALMAIVGISANDDDDGNSGKGYSATQSVKIISKEQSKEIETILQECSPKYVDGLHKYLKSQNIAGIENIPVELFDRIKDAAIRQRLEWKEKTNELATASGG